MTKSAKFLQKFLKPFCSHKAGSNEEDLQKMASQEQKQIPFETLASATRNFHDDRKLGQGGFGSVYKGKLNDGREIAVKKLSRGSKQGKREFMNEAKLLARVQHRNVVNLLGYCAHGVEKLLVYEYVVNESLDKLLFKSGRRDVLDWKRRHDIITGVAKGLLYLHEDAHSVIIHRDIKASNILLDDKWVPKIADFGMARLYPEDQTHVNTRVAGTNGYMAPEYVMHGKLTPKADVFSFGVVILELIRGQKNSSFTPTLDAQNLLEWAYKLYKNGNCLEMMDPTLASSAQLDQVAMCIQIGLLCTQSDPLLRPTMRSVVVMLSKKSGTLEEPTRPGYLGSRYNRRIQRPSRPTSSSGGSTSRSSGPTTSTASRSTAVSGSTSSSFGLTTNSTTTVSTTSSSYHTSYRSDPHGKRPMKG